MVDLSRRKLLGIAGGGAATAAAGGGYVLLSDSSEPTASSNGGTPYETWVPRAGAIFDTTAVTVNYFEFDHLREHEAALPFDLSAYLNDRVGVFAEWGAELGTISGLSVPVQPAGGPGGSDGEAAVYHGSFDPETVASRMTESEPYERTKTYQGYEVVAGSSQTWAVGSEAVVQAPDAGAAELLIDTNRGEATRAVDEDENVATAVDAVGGGTSLRIVSLDEPSSFLLSDTLLSAERLRVDGPETSFKFVTLLAEESTQVDRQSYRSSIEDYQVDGVSVSRDGAQVTASGTFETSLLTRDVLESPDSQYKQFPLPSGDASPDS